jgi:hypothetical protein
MELLYLVFFLPVFYLSWAVLLVKLYHITWAVTLCFLPLFYQKASAKESFLFTLLFLADSCLAILLSPVVQLIRLKFFTSEDRLPRSPYIEVILPECKEDIWVEYVFLFSFFITKADIS